MTAWVCQGFDEDDPETPVLVVTVDPERSAGERAVAALGARAHEGGRAFHVVGTDGWVKSTVDDGVLRAEFVVHAAVLADVGIDPHQFGDEDPVVILAVRTEADAVPAATAVFHAPAHTTLDAVLAAFRADDDWPLTFAALE